MPGADIINGDGSDRDLLLEEGLTYADSLVALTGLDEENIFLALYGKLHSNAKLIAKVNKIAFDDVIDSFGIDSIIYPKYLTADYILQYVRARQNTIGCNVEHCIRSWMAVPKHWNSPSKRIPLSRMCRLWT